MPNERPVLLLATTSPGKIREFKRLLEGLPARLATPPEVGLDLDVAEGEESFAANAERKARAYGEASGLLTLAEDSGFEVDALGGAPGVTSARWGDTNDYTIKNRRILDLLAGRPPGERRCRYVSCIAIREPNGRIHRFRGTCEGCVALEPAGAGGFGFDPIFYVPELGRTMAELSPEEKDRLSHRGRATRQALPLLRRLISAARAAET